MRTLFHDVLDKLRHLFGLDSELGVLVARHNLDEHFEWVSVGALFVQNVN